MSDGMNDPIEIIKHTISPTPRKGAGGSLYIEKQYSIKSKVDAMAISVGNTHLQTSKLAKIDFDKILEIIFGISFSGN